MDPHRRVTVDSEGRPVRDGRLTALAALGLLAVVALGCGPRVQRYPELLNRDLFLCCSLHFNRDHEANDANYAYVGGTIFRAGTPVRVLGDDDGVLLLQVADDSTIYRLGYRFGRARMDARQWYNLILRDTDPRPIIAKWPPEVVAAVDSRQVTVGLTKNQLLTARSYPPFHRTASLESDEWVYYDNGDVTHAVVFADGKVATVSIGPPPDRRHTDALFLEPFILQDGAPAGRRPPLVGRLSGEEAPPTGRRDSDRDPSARLRELQDLHDRGVISNEEYRRARARIVGEL